MPAVAARRGRDEEHRLRQEELAQPAVDRLIQLSHTVIVARDASAVSLIPDPGRHQAGQTRRYDHHTTKAGAPHPPRPGASLWRGTPHDGSGADRRPSGPP